MEPYNSGMNPTNITMKPFTKELDIKGRQQFKMLILKEFFSNVIPSNTSTSPMTSFRLLVIHQAFYTTKYFNFSNGHL